MRGLAGGAARAGAALLRITSPWLALFDFNKAASCSLLLARVL